MRASFFAFLIVGSTGCFTFVEFDLGEAGSSTGAQGGAGAGSQSGGTGPQVGGGQTGTGGASCSGQEVLCGSTCVDTGEDQAHCGACDHDCGGGDCESGLCEPFALVSGLAKIHGLTLDTDRVYFTTSTFDATANDTVGVVQKSGGAFQGVSVAESAAQQVVVVGPRLYWTNWEGMGRVRSVPLDASESARNEWIGSSGAFGIRPSGGKVFFGGFNDGLYSLQANASQAEPPVTNVLTGTPNIVLFVVEDNEDIVFTLRGSANGVWRKPGGGSMAMPLTSGDTNAWGITQDAGAYYYSDEGTINLGSFVPGSGKLHRIDRITGAPSLLADNLTGSRGIAVDDDCVYVAGVNHVTRVSKDGQNKTDLAIASGGTMIEVDDKFIYWTNYDGGTLMKMAKPL